MNRLMTLWLRGAAASDFDRPAQTSSSAALVRHYRVDGDADESLLWIEANDRGAAETALQRLPYPSGEVFAFDLVREVGASMAAPTQWLYLVHTDIPADIVDDYN